MQAFWDARNQVQRQDTDTALHLTKIELLQKLRNSRIRNGLPTGDNDGYRANHNRGVRNYPDVAPPVVPGVTVYAPLHAPSQGRVA